MLIHINSDKGNNVSFQEIMGGTAKIDLYKLIYMLQMKVTKEMK